MVDVVGPPVNDAGGTTSGRSALAPPRARRLTLNVAVARE
jgi:hypothetical protein